MKEYHCGTLVPGCPWHTQHEEEAEIVRRAIEHMRATHGDDSVNDQTVGRIKERITEQSD